MYSQKIDEFRCRRDYEETLAEYVKLVYSSESDLALKVYHTNAIEGNTLSYNDTREVLTEGEGVSELLDKHGSKTVQEALNFVEVIKIFPEIVKELPNEESVLLLHEMLMQNVLPAEKVGVYRTNDAYTMVKNKDGSTSEFDYDAPETIQEGMDDLLSYVKKFHVSQIAMFKLEFVVIHPFADGNGRVSRLLLDWLLIYSGYPPINITIEEREEYLDALSEFTANDNHKPFVEFIQKKVYKVLTEIFE